MRGARLTSLLSALLGLACGNEPAASTQGDAGAGASASAGTSSAGAQGGQSMAGASTSGPGGASGAGGVTGGAGGGAGTTPVEPYVGKLSDCELAFPYQDQDPRGHWLGGDSNFSVVLSPSRALMTFQDTFVGGQVTSSRMGSGIVGNTLASIACESGQYAIEYAWGGAESDHQAMFDDQNPEGQRLWVHRPWLHEGHLFLTATRVSSDDTGFAEHGMTLARVDNPLDPPAAWNIDYFNLTDQRLTIGKGIADSGDHIYLFTPYQANMILVRIAKAELLREAISETSLEYLSSAGSWEAGVAPGSAKKLGLPGNTGLTVRYHAASQRWLALFTNTSGWPSDSIGVSSAPALEGPWTQPTEIYAVPEMDPGAPEYDADTICYGAAEHDAFNPDPDGKILLTYTCNSNDFQKLLANMAIYVPRVVEVENPLLP
jgi:hypothetical protein